MDFIFLILDLPICVLSVIIRYIQLNNIKISELTSSILDLLHIIFLFLMHLHFSKPFIISCLFNRLFCEELHQLCLDINAILFSRKRDF